MYPLGMWTPVPSATRVKPMRRRKLRASIFTVGWRFTKAEMPLEARSITATEVRMAATITGT
jgi:hypothetical protein